jgi:membrane-bound lytic murein transglycosylase D
MIRSGQRLVIYVPKASAGKYTNIENMSFEEKQGKVGKTVAPVGNSPVTANNQAVASGSAIAGDFVYYTVRSGDTLWEIAKKFPGVSDSDIVSLNNMRDGDSIKPGQIIKIKKKS